VHVELSNYFEYPFLDKKIEIFKCILLGCSSQIVAMHLLNELISVPKLVVKTKFFPCSKKLR
jgi:hypothetical protein